MEWINVQHVDMDTHALVQNKITGEGISDTDTLVFLPDFSPPPLLHNTDFPSRISCSLGILNIPWL